MTFGFRQAGIKVVAGIDNDIECKETYVTNNPESKFIHADIKIWNEKELEDLIGLQANDDSLVFLACSPCQYFSKINTIRESAVKSKNLIEDFQRFVRYFIPGYVVLENLPGIVRKKIALLSFF